VERELWLASGQSDSNGNSNSSDKRRFCAGMTNKKAMYSRWAMLVVR